MESSPHHTHIHTQTLAPTGVYIMLFRFNERVLRVMLWYSIFRDGSPRARVDLSFRCIHVFLLFTAAHRGPPPPPPRVYKCF